MNYVWPKLVVMGLILCLCNGCVNDRPSSAPTPQVVIIDETGYPRDFGWYWIRPHGHLHVSGHQRFHSGQNHSHR